MIVTSNARTAPLPGPRPVWFWDAKQKRYRDGKGRYLSNAQMLELRDSFIASQTVGMRNLAGRLASGDLTVQRWLLSMRESVKQVWTAEYTLARGGRKAMTPADFGKLGSLLREQYGYLQTFATEVQAGNLTEAQIGARGELYVDGATRAYEVGRGASYGVDLPCYPGDGGTGCRSRCKCHWELTETTTHVFAKWKLSNAEHCTGCVDRSVRYALLMLPKPAEDKKSGKEAA